jgi:retron-type reverse transcriptase
VSRSELLVDTVPQWVLEGDLRACFDTIAQEQLIDLIAEAISDGRVLQLVRDMLRAGVWQEGRWAPTETGVPQGGVATPPTMKLMRLTMGKASAPNSCMTCHKSAGRKRARPRSSLRKAKKLHP